MRRAIVVLAVVVALLGQNVWAQEFNWKKHQGQTITFLASNHPWANAVLK